MDQLINETRLIFAALLDYAVSGVSVEDLLMLSRGSTPLRLKYDADFDKLLQNAKTNRAFLFKEIYFYSRSVQTKAISSTKMQF